MKKLLIFDMDGLMFESGKMAFRGYLESARKYDYQMTHDVYYYLTGRTCEEIYDEMENLYGSENDTRTWREEMLRSKQEILEKEQKIGKKPGLLELLQYCRENEIQTAMASSNDLMMIRQYLQMEKMEGMIPFIVSGEEVRRGKPDPEIFQKACRKAGAEPEEVLVLEDSMVGILAANRAGYQSVWIEDDITELPEYDGKIKLKKSLDRKNMKWGRPDFVCKSLKEVVNLLKEL